MPKVVINACHGGFGLSHEGVLRYAEIKGITLYPEEGQFGFIRYWKVPPEERPESQANFHMWTDEQRRASNQAHAAAKIYDREIPREDPALVQVVEELGKAANDRFADLKVVDVPDDASWEISEYDGYEHVAEVHRTWG